MALRTLKPPLTVSIVALFVAILVSLHLMSTATQDASQLGKMYSRLVLINTLGSALLLGLVGANAYWLFKQLRKKAAGSYLTARMIFLFSLLTLAPASIVFYYSMQFLQRSIDSWFDVRIDQAMEEALQLGQTALDERMSSLLNQTEHAAAQLAASPVSLLAIRLSELHEESEDAEMTLFSRQGQILAFSGSQAGTIIPDLPEIGIMVQVRQGKPYAGIEPAGNDGLRIRALVSLAGEDAIFLQALYPVPLRMAQLAGTVESAYLHYKELTYLRDSLKITFALTLSLVLMLSLLAALWAAFLSIRRLVEPVRQLAIGTRAIAAGDYEQSLPVKDRGELGFLVESFNAMSRKIAQARDEAQRSRQEVVQQHAYLETVLGHLSSGVMSFDDDLKLLTANQAARTILHADFGQYLGWPLAILTGAYPHLADLMQALEPHMQDPADTWQEEITFMGPSGRQELLCRGTPIFGAEGDREGAVMVIDDVTALIQAQRTSAWSEVARRLAHEIKNPLTPIQLSAERLRYKLSKTLVDGDLEVLEKSTRTIVQQVEAMKSMVNAFAEYARPPLTQTKPLQLRHLIEEVVALYPPQSGLAFELSLAEDLPIILADPVKLRQVLHNLIKNAQEAIPAGESGKMTISARSVEDHRQPHIEVCLNDNGPGIPAEQADRIFEPYVTHKTKGTGLGLAIVKRIVEEHGGNIRLDRAYNSGARFIIQLPVSASITSEHRS
jgi:nitrogen fixation/metabolism regulation signal transduction histidine kinase